TKDLQPLARRQLGAKITKIEVMSDYSCRTAFGRVGKKLSQHAYVDALDIRGFVTDKNQQVVVLEGWGATNRDIAAAKA
ncbi:extensin family protein, partial [Microbacteriaceae bacterium K1510]|nr:extensin family protein [Microbacteriaceae bacterium K1510]